MLAAIWSTNSLNQPSAKPKPKATAVSAGRVATTSSPASVAWGASLAAPGSPAASSSRAPSSKRTVAAMPLKSFSASLSSSRDAAGCLAQGWPPSAPPPCIGAPSMPSSQVVEEVLPGRGRGVQVDDAGVADLVAPGLVVAVVGERRLGRVVGDRGGELVGLGDHRPAVPDGPAAEVAPARGGGRAGPDLAQARVRLVRVGDLEHEDRGGHVRAGVDGRDGGPVTDPRLDVDAVAEVGAAGLGLDRVEELLAEVVTAGEPELVLDGRELPQHLEGLDLLSRARVEVDAGVAERRGREGLGGLGAGAEQRRGRPDTAADQAQRDRAAGDQQGLAVPAGRPRRERVPASALEVLRAALWTLGRRDGAGQRVPPGVAADDCRPRSASAPSLPADRASQSRFPRRRGSPK